MQMMLLFAKFFDVSVSSWELSHVSQKHETRYVHGKGLMVVRPKVYWADKHVAHVDVMFSYTVGFGGN